MADNIQLWDPSLVVLSESHQAMEQGNQAMEQGSPETLLRSL